MPAWKKLTGKFDQGRTRDEFHRRLECSFFRDQGFEIDAPPRFTIWCRDKKFQAGNENA